MKRNFRPQQPKTTLQGRRPGSAAAGQGPKARFSVQKGKLHPGMHPDHPAQHQTSKGLAWQCISGCGACCRLDPGERPEALAALGAEEQELYLSMVGADGWCRHYDTGGQRCRIYESRPSFCRVTNLASIFEVAEAEANDFAIACCRQQIRSEHGGRGRVLRRFERAQRQPPTPSPD